MSFHILSTLPIHTKVQNWVERAKKNNGNDIGSYTQSAASYLLRDLQNGGIYNKMIAINPIAPEGITSSLTPLLVGGGSDPWQNVGVPESSSLTFPRGLDMNGGYCRTGLNPTIIFPDNNSAGITLLQRPAGGKPQGRMLCDDGSSYTGLYSDGSNLYEALNNAWTDSAVLAAGTTIAYTFTSVNRTGANAASITQANGAIGVSTTTNSAGAGSRVNLQLYLNAWNQNNTPFVEGVSVVYSFVAVHFGLTPFEVSRFYNIVNLFRRNLGGGWAD
jgi:hypothetical protein